MSLLGQKAGRVADDGPGASEFSSRAGADECGDRGGVRVYLYCVDEGVRAVATPEVQALKARGASLFGCAYGAGRRNIPLDESAAWSGLTVLADVVGSTDRFVSF